MTELEKKLDDRIWELAKNSRTRWLTWDELKEICNISKDRSLRESGKFGAYLCDTAKELYDFQMDRLNGKKHW